MIDVVFQRNCVYQTAYHVVWCPKYRKPVLTGLVVTFLKESLEKICSSYGWPVIALEIQPDHIHMFLSIPPATSVANAVKILKGTSARWLFLEHPELRESLWGGHIWSPSYYVGTAGNASEETIRKYIERTEHIRGRR